MTFFLYSSHVEFRYNLGSGAAVIRTLKKISLGHWHRIQAKRWHRDGMLKLDDHDNVDGQSKGSLRSLEVTEPSYVGGLPPNANQRVLDNLGLKKSNFGFNGCIRRYKLGYKELKIQSPAEPLTLRRVGLSECQASPCAVNPCKNSGTCVISPNKRGYDCKCNSGYKGSWCEERRINPCVPVNPCRFGGICLQNDYEADGFKCECSIGRMGRICEELGKTKTLFDL